MDRALILETGFLVDLEREHHGGEPTGATAFLDAHPGASLYLPFVVPGELAAGVAQSNRSRWDAFLAPFYLLPHTADVSWEFGKASRHLRGTGRLIGANDLWIAATALAYDMPLVTKHVERYRHVPHLEVVGY